MNNIIPFPTAQRQEQIESERNWAYENYTEECIDTSEFVLMMLEDYFASEDSVFDEMDFRDTLYPESQDMHVIVNLISSMFMRYGGIEHFLQEDLDAIYKKIEANKNDIT
jgi:hypothetical protein|tara:strand:- start:22 stop:351 length:330 start_codon:yes stop_codon:yes gene_type:complete